MNKKQNWMLLLAALLLCLSACGSKPTESEPTAKATLPTIAPTETTAPASSAKEASDYYGTWTPALISKGGTTVFLEDYIALGANPKMRDWHFVFRKDGTYQFGNRESCEIEQWEVIENGVVCDGEALFLEDDRIVLPSESITLYFEKISSSQEFWDVPTSSHASEETTQPETEPASGIRPEFQAAMDSYEAFYEEYIELMEAYKKDPTNLSLLGKYSSMLSKMVDIDKAFEAWDQKDMTAEELKYYLEVSARIQQKLLGLL